MLRPIKGFHQDDDRRAHRVAASRWGRLRVLDGAVDFTQATSPPLHLHLTAGAEQAIPPEVDHEVVLVGAVRLEVDFLTR